MEFGRKMRSRTIKLMDFFLPNKHLNYAIEIRLW